MSIQKQCVLRHRTEGYVRFSLPAALCRKTVAPNVAAKIKAIDGVYRVSFYVRQGKFQFIFKKRCVISHSWLNSYLKSFQN